MATYSREVLLPEWQSDSEVTACPICSRPFTFLFRKHHCRRCGRIICEQCSPHRITIPRQYIVRPPSEALRYRLYNVDGHGGDGDFASNPALGGGETVRVCNPCVPDPNYGPPPQQGEDLPQPESRAQPAEATAEATRWRTAATRRTDGARHQPYPPRTSFDASGVRTQPRTSPERYRLGAGATNPVQRGNGASVYYNRRSASVANASFPAIDPGYPGQIARTPSNAERYQQALGQSPSHAGSRQIPGQPGPASSSVLSRLPLFGSAPTFPVRPNDSQRGLGPAFEDPSLRQPMHPRVRQPDIGPVREEDECPVCGTHEPPFGPDGDSRERERHIEECINNRLAFGSPSRQRRVPTQTQSFSTPSSSTPPQRMPAGGAPASAVRALTSTSPHPGSPVPIPGSGPSAVPTQPRGHPQGQRMLVYHATEKDSTDEFGEPQECVICFEEFVQGDEMGRLECLCKFHRACIRSWWEMEGHWGDCPTHKLHE